MRNSGMGNASSDTTLHRIDPARNMSRYYALSIQPNLFGGHSLMRMWGRIGTVGQSRIDLFDDKACALEAHDLLLKQKRNRGYKAIA